MPWGESPIGAVNVTCLRRWWRLVVPCVAALVLAAAAAPTPALGASVMHDPGASEMFVVADAGESNRITVTSTGSTVTVTDPGAAGLGTEGDCGPAGQAAVACPAADITALDVSGGDGDDEIVNASGISAQLHGDDGDDRLRGGAAVERLEGGAGADVLVGGGGDDQLYGATAQDPDAGSAADTAADQLAGGAGDDQLVGSGGGDSLDGGTGNDQIAGGSGEDYLDARQGVDRLDGGAGPDVVVSRDGTRDQPVSCGPGQDFAIVDRRDRVVRSGPNRCEQVDDGRATKPRPGRVYVRPAACGAELGLPAMHRLVPLRYPVLLRTGYRGRPAPWFDASDCRVRLTATPGQGRSAYADVSGGAAQLNQTAGRQVATLLGVVPPECAGAGAARAQQRSSRLRVKTGRGRGHWRVRGKYSVGASFGTDWTTVEGCSQTTTIVRRGRVRVRDDVRRRTVVVRAGHRYVARR
jgi:RTX calcium-binding nonapeptide repeat (4 copies)